MGNNGERREQLATTLRHGDRVAVFTTFGGRFRRGLLGTVMVISTRLGRGERVTVLLDVPTRDGFGVLDVASYDLVRVASSGTN
jgi:hypothetical protein